MPPHNGFLLPGPQQPVQAAMTLAQPFNDVQMVALIAAHCYADGDGSAKAVEVAQDLMVESYCQRKRFEAGLMAVMEAEKQAERSR